MRLPVVLDAGCHLVLQQQLGLLEAFKVRLIHDVPARVGEAYSRLQRGVPVVEPAEFLTVHQQGVNRVLIELEQAGIEQSETPREVDCRAA